MGKYRPSDKLKQALAEPIEFDLCGKTFVIEKVTTSLVQAISDAAPENIEDAKIDILENQIKVILDAIGRGDEFEAMKPLDVRELQPLVQWLMGEFKGEVGGEEKNAPAATPTSPTPSPDCSAAAT